MKQLVIIIVSIFIIAITGFLIISSQFSFNSAEIYHKKTVTSEKIKQIEIAHSSTDVHILPAMDKEITVELNGKVSRKMKNLYKLEVKEDGDKLKIAVNRDNKLTSKVSINYVSMVLEVRLPEKMYEMIDVDLTSGDIMLDHITADKITLNTSSGDIETADSEAVKSFSVHSLSGDLTMKNIKAENLQIDLISGDSDIQNAATNAAVLSSTSGDIQMNQVDGQIEASTMAGDIALMKEEMNSNMKIEATSGDVDIRFKKKPQSLSLKYNSASGEANVQLDGMVFDEKSEHSIIGKIGNGQYSLDVRTASGDFTIR
nr:DUF4097 family beta strand repeat-containing protein [uncultured Bacillus sp.]